MCTLPFYSILSGHCTSYYNNQKLREISYHLTNFCLMNSLQFIPFIKQGITLLLTQDTGSFYKKLFLPEIKGL